LTRREGSRNFAAAYRASRLPPNRLTLGPVSLVCSPMSRAAAPPISLASVFARHPPRKGEFRAWVRAWGERVVKRLRALGLEVDGCATEEERVVFVPDGRLSLVFCARSHVEVALQLPPRDLPALRTRLADADRALELTTVIESLPEQFETGGADDGRRVPASGASADDLRALLERVEQERQPLWLGWRVSGASALEHAALLDELLEDALVALGGLLARTPREREPEGEPEADPESAMEGEGPASKLPRTARLRVAARPGLRRRPLPGVDPRALVEKGVSVRVLEGPFAGKVGVVQKLDGRGGARVMLGLLAVRLEVKDVVACSDGRGRPLLSSSHRRPLQPRRVRS
jgi:hypothetical protein